MNVDRESRNGTTMHVARIIRGRALLLTALVFLAISGLASPATASPAWKLDALSNTTALPGGTITYYTNAVDIGDANTNGAIVTTITLPAGVTGLSASGSIGSQFALTCTAGDGVSTLVGASTIRCETSNVVSNVAHGGATRSLRYKIATQVAPGVDAPATLTASFGVSGGGALPSGSASTVDITRIEQPRGFGIANFDNQLSADVAGTPFTQAGGHPYATTTSIDFNTINNPLPLIGDLWPVEPTKDVVADLPPGLVGSPAGIDECTATELAHTIGATAEPFCPPTSQVGTTLVRLNALNANPYVFGPIPVFNMVPPPNAPAEFGFNVFGTVVTFTARLRSDGDYGLSVDVNDISEGLAIPGTTLTFWGVPSDPSHDGERACAGQLAPWQGGSTCTSGARPTGFVRNTTSCVAPAGAPVQDGLVMNLQVDSWVKPGAHDANGAPVAADPNWQTASAVSHSQPGYPHAPEDFGAHLLPSGCNKVPFAPTFALRPTTGSVRASSPTPFTVDVDLPQSNDPTAVSESDLKKTVVTLPTGVRISPSSADGLTACSPAQIGLHSTADAQCPDSSKVATMTITTPLIDQHLSGSVYVATPHDNPFNALVAIYLVAKGPGVIVKLAGNVEMDPNTGQLTTTVESPQLPFSNLHLEFFGGPRAPLMTPPTCGTYVTRAVLTPWARPDSPVTSTSSFTVDQNADGSPCSPPGFAPGFTAGSASPDAGKSLPFTVRLTRSDSDQEFSSLSVDTPTGLLGKIASAALCPDGAANSGGCTDASKVGRVTVGAGAGPDPFYITGGRAYITGPYKGAPYGLSVVVPAVAGPFDLGNVVVRAAIRVDRHTAQLRVVSDPLPTILQGIPLDLRYVRVVIDKRDFIVNPTSCAPKNVFATIGSTLGTIVHRSAHFQVANCATLRLAPKLTLTVGARRHTRAGVSTPVTATLTQKPGQTNLRSVSVALPGTLNALLPVVNRACKLTEFNAGHCSNKARVGSAVAVTPLLRDPLRGSVYFVKNPARILPDLMVALRGQVDLDLTGKVSIPGGKRLATRFDTIPDAPITKFSLRIVSGKNGPVGIATNLCSRKGRSTPAVVGIRGQNNAVLQFSQRLHVVGCPRAAKARGSR